MNKKWVITASIIVIVLLVVPVSWILTQHNSTTESETADVPSVPDNSTLPEPEESEIPSILCQLDIEHFSTGLATADGKVYTIDIFGGITCYDAKTGDFVWKESIGGYRAKDLVIYDDKIYGGTSSASVGCLDKETGRHLWG